MEGYAVTGVNYPNNGSNMFVAKLSSTGALLWSKYLGDAANNDGKKIIETNDGGLAVIGNYGTGPSLNDDFDVFLVKLKSDGALQWAKHYGGNKDDYGVAVIQTSNGNYVITGGSYSFNTSNSSDVYNLKTDASGNVIKSTVTSGSGQVIFTYGSGYIVGGFDPNTFTFPGLLIRLDANLNTCNSKNVTTIAKTSTRNVDAAFHKKSRIYTVSPLAFTTINSPVTISQICSTPAVSVAQKNTTSEKEFTASIYPNPVKDNIHVQINTSKSMSIEMRIINQQGTVFLSKNGEINAGNQTEIINTSSLINGMYFLSIHTDEGNKLIPFSKQ